MNTPFRLLVRGRGRRRVPRALVTLATSLALAGCAFGPAYDGPVSDHFDGERFHNPRPMDRSFLDFLKWRLTADPGKWRMQMEPPGHPPPPERVGPEALRVTFVNHASVLIQTAGLNILTDPHWSERASPVGWAGPRRHRPPGVAFDQLPPIDAVLVSHNHYDHMDLPTLERLQRAHAPRFVVPLANGAYLACAGIRESTELDWWQSVQLGGGVRVHSVPARHWSKRRLFDTNAALWAGFYIEAPAGRVYFAGDTGMADHFAAIRRRLGSPAVAMLPIGAYKPRWFMAAAHISPAEAVAAYRTLGAEYLMPIHFGTFPVGDDGQDEPVRALRHAAEEVGVDPARVWILEHGEARRVEGGPG